jgi:GNAT superfamily N-acetyltransferase
MIKCSPCKLAYSTVSTGNYIFKPDIITVMQIDLTKISIRPTKVYYLKMEYPPKNKLPEDDRITFAGLSKPIEPEHYLYYYTKIGLELNWLDRLLLPKEQLRKIINAPDVEIFVMKVDEMETGYVEFIIDKVFVELNYFGLFPECIGKGLGKYFLNWCIQKAWSYDPKWIQVNTCDLDHPNALPNYRKLGFKEYKTVIEDRKIIYS